MKKALFANRTALPLVAMLLAFSPLNAPTHAAAVSAPAATSADVVLSALTMVQHGDVRPIEALLAGGAVRGGELALLEARKAAAFLQFDDARAALTRYFALRDSNDQRLSHGHEIAADVAFLSGNFDEAAHHAKAMLGLKVERSQDKADGIRRMLEIATLLADEPAQTVDAQGNGAPVPLVRDKVGLLRSPMTVNGAVQEAVLDTGANVSVISASAAEWLGLRLIAGSSSIGNSVGTGVGIRIAIADRVELGGAVARNVVFAVMEDAALEFPVPGGYKIDAILGLPVMRGIGRMEYNLGEKTLRVMPSSGALAANANMRMIGNNPYVLMTVAGVELPLFIDTGANTSALYPGFAALAPHIAPVDTGQVAGKAGAGDVTRIRRMKYHDLAITLGGRAAEMAAVTYEPEGSGDDQRPFGQIGIDLLSRYETFAFDFDAMTLEVGPPRIAGGAATAAR